MKKFTKQLLLEENHHDKEAIFYSERRLTDYIWEVPESLFLLHKKYFFEGAIVVDMGCGPAVSVKNLLGSDVLASVRYIGVDISNEMLRVARKNLPMGKFIHDDIETVKFPNQYADIIISLGALHHSLNKSNTLKNWSKILKKGGLLLLREPTYEGLKRGQGESPMEEGVKFSELIKFTEENNYKVLSVVFFSSRAFHLFNRIMIAIGLGSWRNIKLLWVIVTSVDVLTGAILARFLPFFKGLSFTLVAQKV